MSSNKLSPDLLDSSFEDYDPGSVVIGQESLVDGAIGNVVAHRITSKRWAGVNGGRARLRTGPQDTELILEVNAHADELLGNQTWQQQNPEATRGALVHSLLEEALFAKYGMVPTEDNEHAQPVSRQGAYGRAEPIDPPQPIPESPWLKRVVPPPVTVYAQLPAAPSLVPQWQSASATVPLPPPQAPPGLNYGPTAQSLLAAGTVGSLGIEGLDLKPFKAKYAVLVDQAGKQHRLRWHWIRRIEEEACLLIFDSRGKSVSSDKLQRLVSLRASMLFWGDTAESVMSGMSVNLVPSVQTFRFGCFVFYYFLLAE